MYKDRIRTNRSAPPVGLSPAGGTKAKLLTLYSDRNSVLFKFKFNTI